MRGMNTHTLACTPITHTHTPHIQRLTHTPTEGQVTTYSVTGDGRELSFIPVLSGIVRNKQKSFAALLQEGKKMSVTC